MWLLCKAVFVPCFYLSVSSGCSEYSTQRPLWFIMLTQAKHSGLFFFKHCFDFHMFYSPPPQRQRPFVAPMPDSWLDASRNHLTWWPKLLWDLTGLQVSCGGCELTWGETLRCCHAWGKTKETDFIGGWLMISFVAVFFFFSLCLITHWIPGQWLLMWRFSFLKVLYCAHCWTFIFHLSLQWSSLMWLIVKKKKTTHRCPQSNLNLTLCLQPLNKDAWF